MFLWSYPKEFSQLLRRTMGTGSSQQNEGRLFLQGITEGINWYQYNYPYSTNLKIIAQENVYCKIFWLCKSMKQFYDFCFIESYTSFKLRKCRISHCMADKKTGEWVVVLVCNEALMLITCLSNSDFIFLLAVIFFYLENW